MAPPAEFLNDRPERVLADGVPPGLHGWQEQQRLLNIGSQVPQMHDLGDAGAAHLSESCQIGVVLHSFLQQHLFEANGQGHQACDSG